MGTQEVHIKGLLTSLARLARRAGTRDFCPALAALVSPVQNIFFLTVLYFTLFFPSSSSKLGSQAVVLRRLSLYICLWSMTRVSLIS
jgi:hypothetical protein